MASTFWDRVAPLYDLSQLPLRRAVKATAQTVAGLIPPGAHVLDCAAGTGALSLAAAPSAAQVLCTDQSPPMLHSARRKAQRAGLHNITFAVRDLLHLPDPDGCYDVVIAGNVLHLLDTPRAAVEELLRVTRPGGTLLLPTFLQGESAPWMRRMLQLWERFGFHPRARLDRAAYQALLAQCGAPCIRFQVLPGPLPVGFAHIQKAAEGLQKGAV